MLVNSKFGSKVWCWIEFPAIFEAWNGLFYPRLKVSWVWNWKPHNYSKACRHSEFYILGWSKIGIAIWYHLYCFDLFNLVFQKTTLIMPSVAISGPLTHAVFRSETILLGLPSTKIFDIYGFLNWVNSRFSKICITTTRFYYWIAAYGTVSQLRHELIIYDHS